MALQHGSRRSRIIRRTASHIERAQGHESVELKNRLYEGGPRSFVLGLGIVAVQHSPEVVTRTVNQLILGKNKRIVGAGGESIVIKEKGSDIFTKAVPVDAVSAGMVFDQFESDLALAEESFGDQLAPTELEGVFSGNIGRLKGPFVIMNQKEVEGESLFSDGNIGDPDLVEEIERFLERVSDTIDNKGRLPDLVNPGNVLVDRSGQPRIQMVDFSMKSPEPDHPNSFEDVRSYTVQAERLLTLEQAIE